jgi:type IV pilus assembly protein PilC
MLEVGVAPLTALTLLSQHGASPPLARALDTLAHSIAEGESFAIAMRRAPHIFNDTFTRLVEAGEASGSLPETLRKLARHTETQDKTRREIRAAMIYPLCIVICAAIVSSLLLIFVIPSLKEVFADSEAALPWLTRAVIATSDLVIDNGAVVCAALGLILLLAWRFLATADGKKMTHFIALNAPFIRHFFKQIAAARVTDTLGMTLHAGVPILAALRISAQVAGNHYIAQELEETRSHVASGASLSEALTHSRFLTPSVIQMLRIGETTGSLDKILTTIATQCEDDLARARSALKNLLEPALIATLGGIIGTLVIAAYLPIFSMGSLLGR